MKASTEAVGRLLAARGADGVTDALAREQLHQTRIAARVWELVNWHGWVIDSEKRAMTGDGTPYSVYTLVSRPEPSVFAGSPVGKPRPCPSCRQPHEAGRTCSWEPATA